MNEYALTISTVRDGPVCTLILSGSLDLTETGGFLEQAALAAVMQPAVPHPAPPRHGCRDRPLTVAKLEQLLRRGCR
jgi:hypothetical protein